MRELCVPSQSSEQSHVRTCPQGRVKTLPQAPLGRMKPRLPAEDKPEHCHCSSAEVLLSAAMQSEPHEFCLCDFLQLTVSSLAHSQTEL